eukprot:3291504-Alexandrium_andersonii.AAC.1
MQIPNLPMKPTGGCAFEGGPTRGSQGGSLSVFPRGFRVSQGVPMRAQERGRSQWVGADV